jgi:hypothetical protein
MAVMGDKSPPTNLSGESGTTIMFPTTIHMMTAGLTPGDAVSNFVISSGRILRNFGVQVYLYADHVAPSLASEARHSRFYPNNGQEFLWFHSRPRSLLGSSRSTAQLTGVRLTSSRATAATYGGTS